MGPIATTAATMSASPGEDGAQRKCKRLHGRGTVARLQMGGDDRGANKAGGAGIALARVRGTAARIGSRRTIGILFFIGVSVDIVAAQGAHNIARLGLWSGRCSGCAALPRRREALVPRPGFRLAPVVGILFVYDIAPRQRRRTSASHHTPPLRSTSTTRCSARRPRRLAPGPPLPPVRRALVRLQRLRRLHGALFATIVVAALLWRTRTRSSPHFAP